MLADLRARKGFAFDADSRCSLLELAVEAFFEFKQLVEVLVREEATHEHPWVLRADAVDAAVALDKPHRVPWKVVVDDVAGLLEVHALGQHVRGQEQVQVITRPLGSLGRHGANRWSSSVLLMPSDPVTTATLPRYPLSLASASSRRRSSSWTHSMVSAKYEKTMTFRSVRSSADEIASPAACDAMATSSSTSLSIFGSRSAVTVPARSANARSSALSRVASRRSAATS